MRNGRLNEEESLKKRKKIVNGLHLLRKKFDEWMAGAMTICNRIIEAEGVLVLHIQWSSQLLLRCSLYVQC